MTGRTAPRRVMRAAVLQHYRGEESQSVERAARNDGAASDSDALNNGSLSWVSLSELSFKPWMENSSPKSWPIDLAHQTRTKMLGKPKVPKRGSQEQDIQTRLSKLHCVVILSNLYRCQSPSTRWHTSCWLRLIWFIETSIGFQPDSFLHHQEMWCLQEISSGEVSFSDLWPTGPYYCRVLYSLQAC